MSKVVEEISDAEIVEEVAQDGSGAVHTTVKKGGLFGSKTITEFQPRSALFDFKEGQEKQVKESLKGDMFEMVRKLEWSKSSVTYNMIKIDDHPRLEPGYAYEIQLNGDGGSYIDKVLEAFKDPEVHYVWIECAKSDWVFVELKLGTLETSFSPIPPNDDDIVIPFVGKDMCMKSMFVESYALYYTSLVLLFLSVLSFPLSAMFKYVWLDQEKKMVNKSYYTKEKYMPIDLLRSVRSTEEERLSAVKFSKRKGWHFVFEEFKDGMIIEYEQRISNGVVMEKTKVKETPDLRMPQPNDADNTIVENSQGGE